MEDIERPKRIVWDLDPGPSVTWKQVVTAAGVVRDVLKTLGLTSWVKTTGGRGLHVVVPIAPARDVLECLEFSRAVSEAIVSTEPRLYTTTFAKIGRESMPINWSDLTVLPNRWTLQTVLPRLKRLRTDPWAKYWACRQQLSDASIAALRRL
jgi:bifunctional non-homologous end joining protein LigD